MKKDVIVKTKMLLEMWVSACLPEYDSHDQAIMEQIPDEISDIFHGQLDEAVKVISNLDTSLASETLMLNFEKLEADKRYTECLANGNLYVSIIQLSFLEKILEVELPKVIKNRSVHLSKLLWMISYIALNLNKNPEVFLKDNLLYTFVIGKVSLLQRKCYIDFDNRAKEEEAYNTACINFTVIYRAAQIDPISRVVIFGKEQTRESFHDKLQRWLNDTLPDFRIAQHPEIGMLLAKYNKCDHYGRNPLIYSTRYSSDKVESLLAEIESLPLEARQVVFKITDKYGRNALMTAARYSPTLLSILIKPISKLTPELQEKIITQLDRDRNDVFDLAERYSITFIPSLCAYFYDLVVVRKTEKTKAPIKTDLALADVADGSTVAIGSAAAAVVTDAVAAAPSCTRMPVVVGYKSSLSRSAAGTASAAAVPVKWQAESHVSSPESIVVDDAEHITTFRSLITGTGGRENRCKLLASGYDDVEQVLKSLTRH